MQKTAAIVWSSARRRGSERDSLIEVMAFWLRERREGLWMFSLRRKWYSAHERDLKAT